MSKYVNFVGRITKDAELKIVKDIPVTNFNVAVNDRKPTAEKDANGKRVYKQTTDYFQITLWRDQAKSMAPYLTKGRLIHVFGDFDLVTWVGRDNKINPTIHLTSPDIEFLDAARKEEPAPIEQEAPAEEEELPFE